MDRLARSGGFECAQLTRRSKCEMAFFVTIRKGCTELISRLLKLLSPRLCSKNARASAPGSVGEARPPGPTGRAMGRL